MLIIARLSVTVVLSAGYVGLGGVRLFVEAGAEQQLHETAADEGASFAADRILWQPGR
jgi:hypothetical protein